MTNDVNLVGIGPGGDDAAIRAAQLGKKARHGRESCHPWRHLP